MTVTQTSPGTAGATVDALTVTVVPGDVAAVRFDASANPDRVAGADGALGFDLVDAEGNVVSADFASDVRVIFEKSATGARSFVSDTSEHAPVRVTHDATAGAHGVAYNLPVADAYVVRVFFRDAELFDAAPKTATISAGPAEAATTIAAGVGLQRAVVGEEASFVVYVSDRYGNVLTAPEPGLVLAATASVVVDGDDPTCESGKVTALDASAVALAWDAVAGRYEGTYTPAIAGLVSVRLFMSGGSGGMGAVAGSPFAARAAPGATSGAACDVHGAGLRGAIVGVGGTVRITARDANGNARLTGGDAVHARVVDTAGVAAAPPTTVTDTGDGTCVVEYVPATASDAYELTMLIGGEHVAGSPYAPGSRGGRRGGGVAREHPRVRGGVTRRRRGRGVVLCRRRRRRRRGRRRRRRRRARRHAHAHVRFRNRAHHDARLRGRDHPGHERRGGRGRRDVHRQVHADGVGRVRGAGGNRRGRRRRGIVAAIVTVYPGATSASTSEMDASPAFPATTTAGPRDRRANRRARRRATPRSVIRTTATAATRFASTCPWTARPSRGTPSRFDSSRTKPTEVTTSNSPREPWARTRSRCVSRGRRSRDRRRVSS